jgi:homocysteine S-methyltransferase
MILDGGLATELESRGFDLSDELWSARLLLDAPHAIREVHLDYLKAGADCVISASYQGTIKGFTRRGLSEVEAIDLLQLSVHLAVQARDEFWSEPGNRIGRLKPLVAASVGPYGAYLADGSEFTGDYNLDARGLTEFHRHRWQILGASGADILACETIPSFVEAQVLGDLLRKTPERVAWFSFSCKDGKRISDGARLAEAATMVDQIDQAVAIGINCTAPSYIPSLIAEIRKVSAKPIVVYPNSGEEYDTSSRQWTGVAETGDFAEASAEWLEAGARLIGGCCRTGPDHIRLIRQSLDRQ